MYRAVIFDVDGTLVDSNDAHARAWAEAMAESGLQVPVERIRPLIGMGGDKLLPRLTGIDIESPDGEAIAEEQGQNLPRALPAVSRNRRAARSDSSKRFTTSGCSWSSPARRQPRSSTHLLRVAGATRWIKSTASSDDARRSKPDPDIVRAALDATGCQANEVVMIGDTPYDIEAAARAGIGTIAVRCGGWTDAALVNALAIYEDPEDLLDHYDGSPFV